MADYDLNRAIADRQQELLAPNGMAINNQLAHYLNRQRWELGLPILELDPDLMRSARAKADDMHKRGYYGHVDPDGYRVKGAECCCVASMYFDAIIQAWMGSPPHREALLSPDITRIGFGIAPSPEFDKSPNPNGPNPVLAVAHFA